MNYDEEDLQSASNEESTSPDEKRRKIVNESPDLIVVDESAKPVAGSPVKDPSKKSDAMTPKKLAAAAAEMPFKVKIKVAVDKLVYTDASINQKMKHVTTFTLTVQKNFHKNQQFYTEVIRVAQKKLLGQQPCLLHIERKYKFTFENPVINYVVTKGKKTDKLRVPYPLTAEIEKMKPPAIMEPPSKQRYSEVFIDFDLVLNAPQWTPPLPPPETPKAKPPPPPAADEQPLKNSDWPEGTTEMVEDMLELARSYCVFPSNVVTAKLARILHSYRRHVDPILKTMEEGIATQKTDKAPEVILRAKTPEPMWKFDCDDDEHDAKGLDRDVDSRFAEDKSIDARQLIDRRIGNRDGKDRFEDRESGRRDNYRGYDNWNRSHERSSSRGSENRENRWDGRYDQNRYQGQRKRNAFGYNN